MVDIERPQSVSQPPRFNAWKDFVITLLAGGGYLPQTPLLWRDALPQHIVEDHEYWLAAPAVEVFCFRNVQLHGPGWMSRDGRVLFDPALYPSYCKDFYVNKRVYNAVDGELSKFKARRLRNAWHISHFNCGVYGHWLGEVMPKLLVIREFLRRWPSYERMPILMPARLPPFVYAHTRAFLPEVPVVTYDPQDEYVSVARLFMPTWGVEHVYNAWLSTQLDTLDVATESPAGARIFVSRRTPSIFRALENLDELEAIATAAGFTTVYPEEHSLPAQIALFKNARTIVGEFGSGLHNAIFTPAGATIVALNWINSMQSRIARLKGHRLGYLLPTSGREVLFSFDGKVQHYRIDPEEFRSKLQHVLNA